jgi:nucleoside-diphosphate-sugar epimerase
VLYNANVVVTRNMCEAALKAGVTRFVHIASIAVYGKAKQSPMREDHPRNPGTPYEQTKKQGEDLVFDYMRQGLPAVSLRPAGIYGQRSRYGQVSFMALLAFTRYGGTRKMAVMKGGPRVQYIHVEDVVGAIAVLLEAPVERVVGKAFNAGDDHPLTQGELFQAVMPILGLQKSFNYPYFTKAFWPFIRILLALPMCVFDRLNAAFEKKWDEVVRAHGLKRMVAPRLDHDFFGFMSGDYILDTSALKALGWTPKYPDAAIGLAEAARW